MSIINTIINKKAKNKGSYLELSGPNTCILWADKWSAKIGNANRIIDQWGLTDDEFDELSVRDEVDCLN